MSLNDALHEQGSLGGYTFLCHVLPVVGIFAGVITTLSVFLSVSFVDILLFSQLDGGMLIRSGLLAINFGRYDRRHVSRDSLQFNLLFCFASYFLGWQQQFQFITRLTPQNTAIQLQILLIDSRSDLPIVPLLYISSSRQLILFLTGCVVSLSPYTSLYVGY